MSGLLLLVTIATWLALAPWLAIRLGNLIPRASLRSPTKLAIFVVLLSAPFIDEAIAARQFGTLCRANGIESADVSRARGKSVKVEYGERSSVPGALVPIQEAEVLFRDATTGEVLIRHRNYYARGGWLMRYTYLGMGHGMPMLFRGNGCGFGPREQVFKAAYITESR
jgi:hypothetical protein